MILARNARTFERLKKMILKGAYDNLNGKITQLNSDFESIQPTVLWNGEIYITSTRQYLTNDEYKLYKFIYTRALSSLMIDSINMVTTIILDNNSQQK